MKNVFICFRLWPNYASALNNLGTVLLAKAEETKTNDVQLVISLVEEAMNRFREAIKTHPHHVHAHYNLAVIYMSVSKYSESFVFQSLNFKNI